MVRWLSSRVAIALARPHPLEDLVADDGQDAPVNPVADEGVALARAGLSVGEHGAVIPSHRVLKHGSAEVVVDLGRVRARARVGIRVGVGVGLG